MNVGAHVSFPIIVLSRHGILSQLYFNDKKEKTIKGIEIIILPKWIR